MIRFIISGYYGFNNLGDEAVLLGIIRALRQVGGERDREVKITVLSARPRETERRYGVEAIRRNNLPQLITRIKESDIFLSGGGSLLQDATGWKSIPYYLGQVLLAIGLGTPAVFYAQGIGPVNRGFNRKLIKLVAGCCRLITVRDSGSRDLLIDMGVRRKLIRVYADPVFALKGSGAGKGAGFRQGQLFNGEKEGNRPLLGISVRPWGNNDYLDGLVRGVNYAADKLKAEIVIVAFHYGEDREISYYLQSKLDGKPVVMADRYSPDEILKIYSTFSFFVGVRLHSLIFAALQGVPFMGISYDPKVDNFLNSLDIKTRCRVDDFRPDIFKAEVDRLWENRFKIIRKLTADVKDLRNRALENAEAVFNIPENTGRGSL